MDLNFTVLQPRYLTDDELDYELKIRGLKAKAVRDNKLKSLNRAIQKCMPYVDKYTYDSVTEIAEIKADLDAVEKLVTDLGDSPSTRVEKKFREAQARTMHLATRVEEFLRVDKSQDKDVMVAEWRSLLLEFEADILEKADICSKPPCINPASRPSVFNLSSCQPSTSYKKSVPVYKWGVKFDGKSNLLSFLEKVDDLMIARNLSADEVFYSAYDLFEGPALTWYRSIRNTVQDWNSLVSLLKSSFLSSDNDEVLWEELRSKKQRKDETVLMYVASMSSLFSRLTISPDESTRLRTIRRNLQPHYLSALALEDIDSTEELIHLSKKIDEAFKLRQQFFSPKAQVSSLSQRTQKPSTSGAVKKTYVSALSCWNCGASGHAYRECKKTRTKFCYGCGKKEVVLQDCPKCLKNRKSEN